MRWRLAAPLRLSEGRHEIERTAHPTTRGVDVPSLRIVKQPVGTHSDGA